MSRPVSLEYYLADFATYADLRAHVCVEFGREGVAFNRYWVARIAGYPERAPIAMNANFDLCYEQFWDALRMEWLKARRVVHEEQQHISRVVSAMESAVSAA